MASNHVDTNWQFNKGLSERNGHMLDNELATDATFKVFSSLTETKTIRAHKYMLISASPVFWAMFCGELQEDGDVIVPDVDPEAFMQMLRYIYTEKITLSGNTVMHVLHAAKKYQLPSMAKLCSNFLDKELSSGNVCSILEHSHFFNETDLAKKCLKTIEENTKEALSSDDFMTISPDTLTIILDSDNLAMKEIEIFERCYEWAIHKSGDIASVRKLLGENIYKIRFPTLSSEEFADTVYPKNVLTKEELVEIFQYLGSTTKNRKPRGFCCRPRKPEPILKKGDEVRLRQTGNISIFRWN